METNIFNEKLLSLQPSLHRFALSLTANSENAKDLTQQTILKALINQDKYQDNTNLKAWAFTIMKNTFINDYRKTKKHGIVLDISKNQYLINSEPALFTPEVDTIQNEVMGKINRLESQFRIPFQMFLAGYKYKEIAEKLRMQLGTIKSRIFFSRKKLMVMLKDFEENRG